MPYTMKVSDKNYDTIFATFLLLIASTVIFRTICTALIGIFSVFIILFYKKLFLNKQSWVLIILIASPLLLEIIFFWNNDSYSSGIKSLEKSISLVLLPIGILGNYKKLQFLKLLRTYATVTTVVIAVFLIRFVVIYPDLVSKYNNGIDLWELGYRFADSVGTHAPALNMHLAFVTLIHCYFSVHFIRNNKIRALQFFTILLFIITLFLVLLINTRVALLNVFIGIVIIFFFEIIKKNPLKSVVKWLALSLIVLGTILFFFVQNNPYMKEKYSTVTFAHMDKVGKLDEIKNPEIYVFNAAVTRLSIWKTSWELAIKNLPFGTGSSDGKPELFKYYKQTNQQFLAKYEFPVHNQFLDFFLKFGFLGPIVVFGFIFGIVFIGFDLKHPIIIAFACLFFISNCTDDFLLRFDGIVFGGFWFSVFGSYWLQNKITEDTVPVIA